MSTSVYVVERCFPYEGCSAVHVGSSRTLALEWIEALGDDEFWDYNITRYEIDDQTTGHQGEDVTKA